MADKLAPMIPKIAPLLRMLGSGSDGEVIAAVRAMLRLLNAAGLDIHVLVERIENPPLSDDEMTRIFDAGYQKRIADEAEQRQRNAVAVISPFADGEVPEGVNGFFWDEIVGHCVNNPRRLTEWERNFIESYIDQQRDVPTREPGADPRRIFLQRFRGKI